MSPNTHKSWDELLNPEVLRPRLIAASVYIAGFEVLKGTIEDRIRDFFWIGCDESGNKIDPKYQSDVLTRNRSPIHASLDWLKEMGAIDDTDLLTFKHVKDCRNVLAHNLLSVLDSVGLPDDFEECLTEMLRLLRKIEVWWIANVEIPANPDFDGIDVDEDQIVPGPIAGMTLLLDIALGSEEQSRFYYNELSRQSGEGDR